MPPNKEAKVIFQEHERNMQLKANEKWRFGIINVGNMVEKSQNVHKNTMISYFCQKLNRGPKLSRT